MIKETKVGVLGGSLSATVPIGIRDLFGVKKGDKAVWIAEIKDDGSKVLTVEFKEGKKTPE